MTTTPKTQSETKSVRISPLAYEQILNHAANMQIQQKRKISFVAALDDILLSLDLKGTS